VNHRGHHESWKHKRLPPPSEAVLGKLKSILNKRVSVCVHLRSKHNLFPVGAVELTRSQHQDVHRVGIASHCKRFIAVGCAATTQAGEHDMIGVGAGRSYIGTIGCEVKRFMLNVQKINATCRISRYWVEVVSRTTINASLCTGHSTTARRNAVRAKKMKLICCGRDLNARGLLQWFLRPPP
jgi:hypothetical protein